MRVHSCYNYVMALFYVTLEKSNGEHQLSSGTCDEEWQIHPGDQVNTEITTAGQSKIDYPC